MTLYARGKNHLLQNNMTYGQHFAFAAKHGLRCLVAGSYLLIHAILPCWYRSAGSKLVAELSRDFTIHRFRD